MGDKVLARVMRMNAGKKSTEQMNDWGGGGGLKGPGPLEESSCSMEQMKPVVFAFGSIIGAVIVLFGVRIGAGLGLVDNHFYFFG